MFFRTKRHRGRKFLIAPNDATVGILLTGRIGGGKTTVLRRIVLDLALQGVHFAIACAKPCESAAYEELLAPFNPIRLSDNIIWNKLTEEMGRKGGSADNLVKFHDDLLEVITRADNSKGEGFWRGGFSRTLKNSVELAYLAYGEDTTYQHVYDILLSAPQDLATAASDHFRSTPCGIAINIIGSRSPELAKPYADFWLRTFPAVGDKANGAWRSQGVDSIAPFVHGPIAKLVNGKSTISTEDLLTRHTIWDYDTMTYGVGGLAFQLMLGWSCKEAVLRRTGDFEYFGLVLDEYHQFAHAERDIAAVAMGRSQRLISIVAYQNQPVLEAALGGGVEAQTQAKALYGTYTNKYFLNQNDQVTAEMQAMTIGQERKMFYGANVNQTQPQDLAWYDVLGVGAQPNFSFSQNWHYRLSPTEFMNLRTGGPEYDFMVDAIIHRGLDGFDRISISQKEQS